MTSTAAKPAKDICPRCSKEMKDGQPVVTDWSGIALEHINCVEANAETEKR